MKTTEARREAAILIRDWFEKWRPNPDVGVNDDNIKFRLSNPSTGDLGKYIAAALVAASPQWQPIAVEPPLGVLLLAGKMEAGGMWRDVGVYSGKTEDIMDFRDKYGSDSHPTHWMPLPAPPVLPAPEPVENQK